MTQDFVILPSDREPPPRPSAAPADAKLVAEGWVRRHAAGADRVEESVELYRSLGFEVLTRELKPADYDARCGACAASTCPSNFMIYTRRDTAGNSPSDEPNAGQA